MFPWSFSAEPGASAKSASASAAAGSSGGSSMNGQIARYLNITTATGAGRLLSLNPDIRNPAITELVAETTATDASLFTVTNGPYDKLLLSKVHVKETFAPLQVALPNVVRTVADMPDVVQFTSDLSPLLSSITTTTAATTTTTTASRPVLGMTLMQAAVFLSNRVIAMYGHPCSGPSQTWVFPVAAVLPTLIGPNFSPSGHATCMRFVSNFVSWLTKQYALPSMTSLMMSGNLAVGTSSPPTMSGEYPLTTTIEYTRALYTEISQRCAVLVETLRTRLSSKGSVTTNDVATAVGHMNNFVRCYLDWRYIHAPLLADGAACLMAYLMSNDPVIYRGLLLENTRNKGQGLMGGVRQQQQSYRIDRMDVTRGDKAHTVNNPEDYIRYHFIVRVAAQYDSIATRISVPTDAHTDLARMVDFIAYVIIERNLYCCCVANQFASAQNCRIAVVENLRFFMANASANAVACVDIVELLQRLAANRFGAVIRREVDHNIVVRSLLPPYSAEPAYKDLPVSVTYGEVAECPFDAKLFQHMWSNQPRSFGTQLDNILNAKASIRNANLLCHISGNCDAIVYPLGVSHVGQRSLQYHCMQPDKRTLKKADTDTGAAADPDAGANGDVDAADADAGTNEPGAPSTSEFAIGPITKLVKSVDPLTIITSPPLSLDKTPFTSVPLVNDPVSHRFTSVARISREEALVTHIADIVAQHGVLSAGRVLTKKGIQAPEKRSAASMVTDTVVNRKMRADANGHAVPADSAATGDDDDDDDDDIISEYNKEYNVNGVSVVSSSSSDKPGVDVMNIYGLRSIVAMIVYYTRFCDSNNSAWLACPVQEFSSLCALVAKKLAPDAKGRVFYNIHPNSALLPLLIRSQRFPTLATYICRNTLPFLHYSQ